ncbi:MAG: sulfatase-like hydrolase/transferase [Proteobacteria bacterium]|nr:sulfatase-like hydrolase/transferase [Pseudomonadota bacterium]
MWIWLLACSDPELPPPSSEMPSTSLKSGDRAPVRLGDRLATATIELSPHNRPDGWSPGRIGLTDWVKDGETWRHSYPFILGEKRQDSRGPISGRVLWVNGKKVKGWRTVDGEISLKMEGDPASVGAFIEATDKIDKWARLDVQDAGLTDAEFVQHEVTVKAGKKETTRPGLLLPAPSSITWTVDVPEGAVLEFGATLVPMGANGVLSDGAGVLVEVDGAEVGGLGVNGDDAFEDLRIDLSRFGGQTVSLTIRTHVVGESDWDYVFVSEPLLFGASEAPPRRVVLIGIDTLRYDELTQHGNPLDVSASLDDFAQGSVLFDNAWAPAPRTRPSFRTATTGHYPMSAITAQTVGEVFRDDGFTTAGITANVHLVPKHGFNDGFDHWQFENSVDADIEVARAKEWLEANEDRDSFLFLHFMDPHNFYRAPGLYTNKYVVHDQGPLKIEMNRWAVAKLKKLTDGNKSWYRERYHGEVAFLADELSKFLAWTLQLEGDTLLVLHSDHGEEFWDHGGYEHNHTLYEEVVRSNLWIRPPDGWGGGPHRVAAPVGLIDIAPTLYDFIGVESETDGTSLRPFLDATKESETRQLTQDLRARPLQLGHLMYDREQWGVVANGRKCILRTDDGDMELYDLAKDPRELTDLADSVPSSEIETCLSALSEATGFPAGLGMRIAVERQTITLAFEKPVDAEILDPDAKSKKRHNVELGDNPDVWPEEVGVVEVSEDGLTVRFTPGTHGKGSFMVLTGPENPGHLVVEDQTAPLIGVAASIGDVRVGIRTGPVLLVRDSVRDRLAMDQREGGVDAEALRILQLLGYMDE